MHNVALTRVDYKSLIALRSTLPLEIALLSAGLLVLLPTVYVYTNYDSSFYLELAISLAANGTYEIYDRPYIDRGPIFPLIIAGLIDGDDFSFSIIRYLPRLFFSISVFICFLFARAAFGRIAAWMVTGFILTTAIFHNTSAHFLLDYAASFFILLSLYLLLLATISDRPQASRVLWLTSGLALGLGYLTKPVAVLFFPLPVLLILVGGGWHARQWRGPLIFYGGLAAPLIPWFVFVYRNSPSAKEFLQAVLGREGNLAAGDVFDRTDVFGWISRLGDGYAAFHLQRLASDFPAFPGLLLGIALLLVFAIRGDLRPRSGARLLLLALLLLAPLASYLGNNTSRDHQSIIYYLLISMSVGAVVYGLHAGMYRLFTQYRPAGAGWNRGLGFPSQPRSHVVVRHLSLLVSVVVAGGMTLQQVVSTDIHPGSRPTLWAAPPHVVGNLAQEGFDAVKWAMNHTSKGQAFLVDNRLWNSARLLTLGKENHFGLRTLWLHMGTLGRYGCNPLDASSRELGAGSRFTRIDVVPFFAWNGLFADELPVGPAQSTCAGEPLAGLAFQKRLASEIGLRQPGRVGAVMTSAPRTCIGADGRPDRRVGQFCTLWILEEGTFLDYLRDNNVRFIVFFTGMGEMSILRTYLLHHPSFEHRRTFVARSTELEVFEVLSAEPGESEHAFVSWSAREVIDWLGAERPDLMRIFESGLLRGVIAADDANIESVIGRERQ